MEGQLKKRCSMCEYYLPATPEYFHKSKVGSHGLHGYCKSCDSKRKKEYREQHKERLKKQREDWVKENPDYNKEYYQKNKESGKDRAKRHRKENPERYRETNQEWCQRNKDKVREKSRKRYERISLLPKDFTKEQWETTKSYFGNKCAYCGESKELHKEHFLPIVEGGGYTFGNILPSCKDCNGTKSTKLFSKWYPSFTHYDPEREKRIIEFTNGGKGK